MHVVDVDASKAREVAEVPSNKCRNCNLAQRGTCQLREGVGGLARSGDGTMA